MDKVLGSVILDHDKELEKLEKELSKAEQGLRRANGRHSKGFVWKIFIKIAKREGLIEREIEKAKTANAYQTHVRRES